MLLAQFFDTNGNNEFDMNDLAVILGITAILIPAIIIVVKALHRQFREEIRDVVVQEIAAATKAIQPNANGGRSLPDANKKLDLVIEHLGINLPESLRVKDLPKL